ncbi:MAG: DUF3037 domain-containing protein [Pirellula sp.]
MNPVQGYYSIVQYCPDLARRETVNIGVVLLVPDARFLKARMVADNGRVHHFFGTKGEDAKLLAEFKKSFEHRIEAERTRITSVETLQKFIDTRGNQLQLTEPNFVKVRECTETINRLFDQLVGGKPRAGKRQSFKESLQERFNSAGIADRICTDVSIDVPILNQTTKIPFGFQNGVFHLLQPVKFESQKDESNFGLACKYSTEGKIFQENPDPTYGALQFNVIGRFPSKSDESIPIVRKVLAASKVRLHLEHDLSELVDEIRRTGKPTRNT